MITRAARKPLSRVTAYKADLVTPPRDAAGLTNLSVVSKSRVGSPLACRAKRLRGDGAGRHQSPSRCGTPSNFNSGLNVVRETDPQPEALPVNLSLARRARRCHRPTDSGQLPGHK